MGATRKGHSWGHGGRGLRGTSGDEGTWVTPGNMGRYRGNIRNIEEYMGGYRRDIYWWALGDIGGILGT